MTQKQLFNRSTLKTYRLSNTVIVSLQAAYLKIILSIFLSVACYVKSVISSFRTLIHEALEI